MPHFLQRLAIWLGLLSLPAAALAVDVGDIGKTFPPPWPSTTVTFPNGVRADGDIVYAQWLHYRPLRLDLYRPANATGSKPMPLIVYVHGGAWVKGTKRNGGPMRDFPVVLANLSARGFIVAAVEYRLDGEAPFPAAIQDVKTAIRFLRLHATDYGIDPARVGIFGGSAGGQLAALAGTSCNVAPLAPKLEKGMEELAPVSDCVQAAVAWYGVHDFQTVPTPPRNTGPAPYLGCKGKCAADVLAFGSPAHYVDRADPPMLLIHGLADTLVAVSQTQEMEAHLKKTGVPVSAIYIPDVDHGFVGKTDAITRAANNQAVDATFAFFEKQLRDR